MPEERRNIEFTLKKLGFLSKPGRGDHTKYSRGFKKLDGSLGKIITIVDHEREIPDGTFNAVLKQVRLSKKKYFEALDCTFGLRDFEKDLII